MRYSDKKAIRRLRHVYDADVKSTIKTALYSVGEGIKSITSKMQERIDPERFSGEQEARNAEKQRLKELSTVKGLLKELFKTIKGNIKALASGVASKAKPVLEKLKNLLIKLKEYVKEHPVKTYFIVQAIVGVTYLIKLVPTLWATFKILQVATRQGAAA